MCVIRSSVVLAIAASTTIYASTAMAADPTLPEPVIIEGVHDWSGVYVGANIGYGGADFDGVYDSGEDDNTDFLGDGAGPFDLKPDGVIGGIQVGYNWQSGSFVYGIEGDIAAVDWSDSLTNFDDELVSVDTNYVATLRARAGYAWDKALVFGTVGAAFTDTEFFANDEVGSSDPDEVGTLDLDNVGLVVGGGVEYALNERWSVKAEGLYFWFNDDQNIEDLNDDTDADDFIDFRNAWMLRVGVNYHF